MLRRCSQGTFKFNSRPSYNNSLCFCSEGLGGHFGARGENWGAGLECIERTNCKQGVQEGGLKDKLWGLGSHLGTERGDLGGGTLVR